jgi:opine dehydrogenase
MTSILGGLFPIKRGIVMSEIERVIVLGAGPGGMAVAAALARRYYDVVLYNRSEARIKSIRELGGIEIEGDFGEEFVSIPMVTTEIHNAMKYRQLILIAVPAYGQRNMMEICLPYLEPGQVILLLTGSAGSLEIAPIIRDAGYNLDEILLAETVTLPQSARMVGEARIRIKLPSRLRAAAFPGRNTERLINAIGNALELIPKPNVLDPGLNNPNFLIHPAPMLLNYAAVEREGGNLSLMNEGMTSGVLRVLDAVDEEKMKLQQSLGLEVVSIDDLYCETGSGPKVYRSKGEPFQLRDRIWDRYIREDVPYGTILFSSLGRLLGVPTPVSDSINTILSIAEQTDFWSQGRTVEKLGISDLNRDQLLNYLETGNRSMVPFRCSPSLL